MYEQRKQGLVWPYKKRINRRKSSNFFWNKFRKNHKNRKAASNHPIIFYGLKNSGLKTPYDDILFEITGQHIIIEQQQLGIIEEIKTAFTKNNIDFAFLKGSRLKNIYPKSEMRVMGDIDVLIKPEQYSKIKNLLLQKNYEENFKWNY